MVGSRTQNAAATTTTIMWIRRWQLTSPTKRKISDELEPRDHNGDLAATKLTNIVGAMGLLQGLRRVRIQSGGNREI
jgi:hypothetical protein